VSLADALVELQELTERLRRDCPWDREQTARTIVPHTLEEAYEVADAAFAADDEKLLGELGDLLFQVYFLALLLDERGAGDLETVARSIHAKLVARHPHVFGDVEAKTPGRVRENWERLKVEQEQREGVFHDVPESLPSLLHARKVQRRAAAVGFAVQRVANEQWAHWPVTDTLAARIRATVEQHFDELYAHGADGFTPRWISMGREVLITWQPGK